MSAADCERWENVLLDLAYGEIEEDGEREVRAHLDGCEHCRRGLEKLERGRALARQLPQEEAPADAMQIVLRAARDKALEIEAARASAAASAAQHKQEPVVQVKPEREPEASGWWATVLSIVMAPQFAMATLLLLTVGVGLWWFPGGGGSAGSGAPLLSEPSELASGPEALTPADPLHFDVDPRTGRVDVHREGNAEEERVASSDRRGIRPGPREAVVADDSPSAAAAAATLHVEDEDSAGAVVDGVLPSTAGPTDSLGMSADMEVEERVAPSPAPTTTAPPAMPEAPTETAPSARTPSTATGSTSPSHSGAAATRELDEVEAPSPDGDVMMAAALLNQARESARSGRDREAIERYESFLSRHRTSSNAPTAMLELAEIYRRTGALSRARSWLERAAAYPSTAPAARRELVRLDAAERERTSDRTSTEPTY